MMRINTVLKTIRLASCHLVVVLILADVSVAAISLSTKRSVNLVDNVGSQCQIRPPTSSTVMAYSSRSTSPYFYFVLLLNLPAPIDY